MVGIDAGLGDYAPHSSGVNIRPIMSGNTDMSASVIDHSDVTTGLMSETPAELQQQSICLSEADTRDTRGH